MCNHSTHQNLMFSSTGPHALSAVHYTGEQLLLKPYQMQPWTNNVKQGPFWERNSYAPGQESPPHLKEGSLRCSQRPTTEQYLDPTNPAPEYEPRFPPASCHFNTLFWVQTATKTVRNTSNPVTVSEYHCNRATTEWQVRAGCEANTLSHKWYILLYGTLTWMIRWKSTGSEFLCSFTPYPLSSFSLSLSDLYVLHTYELLKAS
jgi:hypothetical protein